MPYVPPPGWVEEFRVEQAHSPEDSRIVTRFHARTDCPRVHDVTALRQVDKPYSALRCTLCADELTEPRTWRVPQAGSDKQLA
ncbi:MAG: hypothetical protein QOE19_163 [Actinomycetota bacterium]|jgi:hypothetical protein|nr:hypothetical protein [Actinomycetota bacterium]